MSFLQQRDNIVLSSAGIAEGTNANTFQLARAVDAVIDGRAVRKAATDNIAFSKLGGGSFTAMAAKETCAFFHMMNSAGTVTQIQSTIKPSSAQASYQAGAWEWPQRDGYVCLGATVVRTDNSATFTPGSTDLGATDVVDTHYDALPGVTGKPLTY